MIPQMPFNHHLGLRVTRMYKDGLALECEFRPEWTNGFGTLHGGVTATLIDAAIGIAVIAHSGGRTTNTVELKVNYLRPGVGDKFHCRSRLVKTGRTLVFGEAEVRDRNGALVATGTATYILLDPKT
jgi:acyl-CoA thioesterase